MSALNESTFAFPKEPPLPSINRNSVYGVFDLNHFSKSDGPEESSISGKLSNIEAQRIISVLQEIQRKVGQIGLLPDIIDNRVSSVFGGETYALIRVMHSYIHFKDHKQLELKYKNLIDTKYRISNGGVVPHELTVRFLRLKYRLI